MDAENLGHLIDDDHYSDASLEPDQHRLGDEVGHESETQNGRQDQDGAHHQREERGGLQHVPRIAVGHCLAQCGARQDRQCRGRRVLIGRDVPSTA